MKHHIHIVGASGSGTSTLGDALANVLPHTHLDTDDYFWITKFTEPRPVPERREMLKEELFHSEQWILSGSLVGWGDCFMPYLDLVIFLWIPPDVRLARLQQREFKRYGAAALAGGSLYEQSQAFLRWAALYDHAGTEVRSKTLHEQWLAELACPILRIEGDHSTEERIAMIMDVLKQDQHQ
ncbi:MULTISPECIES: hypothetical protein [unclassified Exiguobacterium]|uniref:hypothetical protein n=1 Tax=unclassified Exiguobacterium TaxID=2644629 RepID=UPI001BEB6612|nr:MULTISPECIES: hypothetical protein [unclassified Exiguobacterium]